MNLFKKIVSYFKKPEPKPKLTDWYPGDIKPVRKGIYQIESALIGEHFYAYWDGKQWRYESDKEPIIVQDREWRGLTK